jgi:signal transduction histidine kinase
MSTPDKPFELEEVSRLKGVLELSRNKLQAAFDAISDPVLSVTSLGQVESLNFAAAHLTKEHPRSLAGLTLAQYLEKAHLPGEVGQVVKEMFQELLDQERPQWRMVSGKNGNSSKAQFFQVSMVPSTDSNMRVNLGMVHIKDITELKRLELMIREYSTQLEQKVGERTQELLIAHRNLEAERDRLAKANQELQRLDQMRQDLTNMVVHDLKGPLAEMMGNLEMLNFGELDEGQKEARELALMGAEDLYRMIMNLLEISRMEEGRLEIRPCEFDFKKSAWEVVNRFKTMIRLREFNINLVDESNGSLYGDPDLLSRVLQNLLTNALNHTEDGGSIEIKTASADHMTVVSLKDTGQGIPKEMHDKLFQKFAGAGNRKKARSTGLGLTFCKMAVEAHGGEIWFETSQGKGTTFFFSLPEKA